MASQLQKVFYGRVASFQPGLHGPTCTTWCLLCEYVWLNCAIWRLRMKCNPAKWHRKWDLCVLKLQFSMCQFVSLFLWSFSTNFVDSKHIMMLKMTIMATFVFIAVVLILVSLDLGHDVWKKRSEETQTLHAGCSKAEPKMFAPLQTPLPGVRDGQNLISWRWSLALPTHPVWWESIHAISSYHGNRPTHTLTDRTNYNTLHRS